MVYCTCSKCNSKLEIDENDYMPGCRESEEVICPKCNNEVTTVFTSGIPKVSVIEEK